MQYLVLILLMFVVQGCASPYAKFYTPAGMSAQGLLKATEEPKVIRGTNRESDDLRLIEDGYRPIGSSSFNGGNVNDSGAITQAKSLGAAVVVLYSQYTHTVSGSTPLTLPSTQTSTTTVSGMVGGQPVFGTGNTTTYGTTTTYIPYSVQRRDYFASYWGKAPPPVLGVFVRDPKPDERKQIGSNTGVVIVAVVKGSPAFSADIFRGDVIKSVAGTDIRDLQMFMAINPRFAGQRVEVVIIRDGKEITKAIQYNPKE